MSARTRADSFAEALSQALSQEAGGGKIITVTATPGHGSDSPRQVSYCDVKVVGNGSFGVVYRAKLCDTGELVAIKKVLQDKRYKNRELQMMRNLGHPNIVRLLFFFYSSSEKKGDTYLNLALEFMPETVAKVTRQYSKNKQVIPYIYVKVYMYQVFRSLAYIHSQSICHRDIKPHNLLVDPESCVLKLCDFGSAKVLVMGQSNVAYICSRFYRAPELIFGASNYTTSIDTWSAGCVLAELILGHPLFSGTSAVDQLVEIIKVLGTPTPQQISDMNPTYTDFKFPQIAAQSWSKIFRHRASEEAIDLISSLLIYSPLQRLSPLEACAHNYFNELRDPATNLPNNSPLPPLFNFTPHELSINSALLERLLPAHLQQNQMESAGSAPDDDYLADGAYGVTH